MGRSLTSDAEILPSNFTALWGATWRNSVRLSRNSASLVSALVIPGVFMLAFWAVFGHAASRSGFDYALFLMAASMFQAVMFAAGGSAMALAVDVESGLLGRMRAMPIHAMVVIGGRMLADLVRSIASLCAVIGVGLACGARPASWTRLGLTGTGFPGHRPAFKSSGSDGGTHTGSGDAVAHAVNGVHSTEHVTGLARADHRPHALLSDDRYQPCPANGRLSRRLWLGNAGLAGRRARPGVVVGVSRVSEAE